MTLDSPVVPQEIINRILEHLGDHRNRKTLETCSLVSSSFREPAQKELFKHLNIVWRKPKRLVKFMKVFKRRGKAASGAKPLACFDERLRSYVEAIVILIPSFPVGFSSYHKLLPRIRRVTLTRDGRRQVRMASMLSTPKNDIQEILERATLQILNIQDVEDVPVNVLRSCVNLKTLGLWASTICCADSTAIQLEEVPGDASLTGGSLDTLRLHEMRVNEPLMSSFRDPSSPLCISNLRRLRYEIWNEESAVDCKALLQISGAHLEELELIITQSAFTAINLAHMQNLQRIKFHPMDVGELVYMSRIFESASRNDSLAQFSIAVDARLCAPDGDAISRAAWRHLDSLLARKAGRTLSQFRLNIAVLSSGPCSLSAMLEFVIATMPRTVAMRAVHVSTCGGVSHFESIAALKTSERWSA